MGAFYLFFEKFLGTSFQSAKIVSFCKVAANPFTLSISILMECLILYIFMDNYTLLVLLHLLKLNKLRFAITLAFSPF